MKKKVLFIHYRIGERDGVSLELEKRAEVFRKLGAEVYYLTGYDGLNRKQAYIVPEMDIKSNVNTFLRESFFYNKMFDEQMIIALYSNLEHKIYNQIDEIIKQISPDLLFVQNVLSMPLCLPATTALIRVMDKYQIPTIGLHHDFWFEREYFLKPHYLFVKEMMKQLPPNRPYFIRQQVINSMNIETLYERRKIVPQEIGDYWDFSNPNLKQDSYNSDIKQAFGIDKNDLIVLQATRIVERKAIENALYYVHFLEKNLRSLAPIQIKDKTFTKDSKVHLVFSNFVEADSLGYFKKLQLLADELKVNCIWASERFVSERKHINNLKLYNFWDSYLYADLVTYPSIQEGFGNQLLEAFFFKKLPIIFEYPVYKKDIKKEGYKIVSLGDITTKKDGFNIVPETTIKQAVDETIKLLKDEDEMNTVVEKNFKLAEKYHDEKYLRKDLESILSKC